MPGLQYHPDGRLRHLLTLEGLSLPLLTALLNLVDHFAASIHSGQKKMPLLVGKTVANLFFEPSTRTRTTFELAAKRLAADVINLQIASSSTGKGETLLDTLKTMEAMQVDLFVIRHEASGAAHFFAEQAAPGVAILNAGDGRHQHPTQGLLDAFTIRRHKPDFAKLSIAIVGDVMHSRVARSDIHVLRTLGVKDLRVVAPRTLVPTGIEEFGVTVHHDMDEGIADVDVLMLLRLQRERMGGVLLPSAGEFHHDFGLDARRLKLIKPDAIVMHPGPINRGVEIEGALAYGRQSVILQQVTHGIAVRMAVMAMILGNGELRA